LSDPSAPTYAALPKESQSGRDVIAVLVAHVAVLKLVSLCSSPASGSLAKKAACILFQCRKIGYSMSAAAAG